MFIVFNVYLRSMHNIYQTELFFKNITCLSSSYLVKLSPCWSLNGVYHKCSLVTLLSDHLLADCSLIECQRVRNGTHIWTCCCSGIHTPISIIISNLCLNFCSSETVGNTELFSVELLVWYFLSFMVTQTFVA